MPDFDTFDHMRPTTLAAILVDLEGVDTREALAIRIRARSALLANCGAEEAARLIDAEKENT